MGATNHKRIALLWILFFMLVFQDIYVMAANQTQLDASNHYSSLLDSAEILKLKGFYDESIELINQVKFESEENNDWDNYTRSLIELTDVLRFTYYFSQDPKTIEEAYGLLDLAHSSIIQHLDTSHIVMSLYYIYKGKLIKDEGKYSPDTLGYYLQKSKAILESPSSEPKYLAKLYYELGNQYRRDSQISMAERYFNQLLETVNEFEEFDYLRAYYLWKANQFYYDIADFEKALLCANIASYIFKHPKHNDIANALDCENDIASIYINSNILSTTTYQKALSHYNKIYNTLKSGGGDNHSTFTTIILFNMGISLMELHDYDSSIQTLQKSIEINPLRKLSDSTIFIQSKLYINLISMIENRKDSIDVKIQNLIEQQNKIQGRKNYKTHVVNRIIGETYERLGNYDIALEYYQQGLISLYKDFNSENIYDNPNWGNRENIEPVLYILLYKARTLYARYKKTGKKADLEAAYYIFKDGYDLMNNLLSAEMMNESFIILFQNFKTEFQTSVECAIEAYEVFEDKNYLNSAFHFIEQSKYFLLLKSQQSALLMNTSGIEKDVFLKERSLTGEIEQFKHQLNIEDKLSPNEAFDIRNALFDKIINRTKIFNQIKEAINTNEINPSIQTLSLDQVQKEILKENEIIVEYYWSKETIYALILERHKTEIEKIPITKNLLDQIDIYTQALSDKHTTLDHFTKFNKSSNYLYHALFEPIIKETSIKTDDLRVTIITDGGLALLPFEAFTTTKTDSEIINYWGLPYLCKHYTINYAYSLNILHKNITSSKYIKKNKKILAMSYSPVFYGEKDDESLRNKNELPYSGLEINEISQVFNDAEFYAYEEATEDQFRSKARDFAIIHLAIHGQADTINRYNSKLLFRPDKNDSEDGQLHDYELYTLDLSNNQLAVLSACETGLGKELEGEGMLSIARGFAYAGSPAIVMSLWKVNDKSTSILMKYFYENLSKGIAKDKALQLAKISYIENSDEISAHPSNWAAFIAMGNNRPIDMSSNSFLKYLLSSIFIVLLIFSILKFKRLH